MIQSANAQGIKYQTLEGESLKSLGVIPTFNTGENVSFVSTTTFLYTLFFVAIVVASFYRYVIAGALRMQASENTIRQSNEIIKRVTLGLLGVFSLFIILFTVNKNMLTGDIDLGALGNRSKTSSQTTIPITSVGQTSPTTGGGSSCEPINSVITKIQSGNICSGTTCSALSGCNWKQYESIINQEVGNNPELKKMIIVTMCKESKAIVNSSHKNKNETYDCGLMQINQPNACTSTSFSVTENIREGVRRMRQKISSASRTYPSIPSKASVFAAYNCCGNGDNPNAPSNDCNTSSGFQNPIPKWACPIKPGAEPSNMCSVKNYACELEACMNQL